MRVKHFSSIVATIKTPNFSAIKRFVLLNSIAVAPSADECLSSSSAAGVRPFSSESATSWMETVWAPPQQSSAFHSPIDGRHHHEEYGVDSMMLVEQYGGQFGYGTGTSSPIQNVNQRRSIEQPMLSASPSNFFNYFVDDGGAQTVTNPQGVYGIENMQNLNKIFLVTVILN